MRKIILILLLGFSFCLSSCSHGKTDEITNDNITEENTDVSISQTAGSEGLTPSGESGSSNEISMKPDSGNISESDSTAAITNSPDTKDPADTDTGIEAGNVTDTDTGTEAGNMTDADTGTDTASGTNAETGAASEEGTEPEEVNHPATLPLEGQNRVFVMSDNGFEEITPEGTDEETAGSKIGEYPKKVSNGTEISVDLDNDNKKETVFLDVRDPISFKVNGKEYGDKNNDGALDSFEVYPDSPSSDGYYITDIDTSDNYKEIAFLEYGPSDDPYTYFFRYQKGKLSYIGGVPFFPFKDEDWRVEKEHFNGAGLIFGGMRLWVFQTWWAPSAWGVDTDGNIVLVEQDWYYPYIYISDFEDEQMNLNSVLLREITVYEAPDITSNKITLKPNNSRVDFLATDNKDWIWLKREDGTGGFLYLNYYENLRSEEEVFSNLSYAD